MSLPTSFQRRTLAEPPSDCTDQKSSYTLHTTCVWGGGEGDLTHSYPSRPSINGRASFTQRRPPLGPGHRAGTPACPDRRHRADRAGKSVGGWAQDRLVPSGDEPSGAAACPPELSGSPRRAGEGPPCQRRHGASRCRVSAGRGMEGAPPLKPHVHLHARYRRGRPSAGNLNLRRKAAAGTCLQYAPGIGAAGPPRARPPVIGRTGLSEVAYPDTRLSES